MWSKYDTDQDGRLSREEAHIFLQDYCKAIHGLNYSKYLADRFLDSADSGHKGFLTRDEFVILVTKQSATAETHTVDFSDSVISLTAAIKTTAASSNEQT